MDLTTTEEIKNFLIKKDQQLKDLFDAYGLLSYSRDENVYESIVYHIVEQMLSIHAARTIYSRLSVLCGGVVTADAICSLDKDDMRQCGISYSKVKYIQEFSLDCKNKKYNFDDLKRMTDEEVVLYLKQINGVGLWTAEMIALFTLGRTNVFSYDDVALRNGIIKAKKYKTLSKKRFECLRRKYSPYCSYISLYFYKCNDDKGWKK